MTSTLVSYHEHHCTYYNDNPLDKYSHSPLTQMVSLCKQTVSEVSPKAKEQPRHIEALAAVDAHSSAAKAPAQLQRPPPVKSSSVLVYVLNWLCCVRACCCSPTEGDCDICVPTICPPLARAGLEAALRARGVLTDEGTQTPPLREGLW